MTSPRKKPEEVAMLEKQVPRSIFVEAQRGMKRINMPSTIQVATPEQVNEEDENF